MNRVGCRLIVFRHPVLVQKRDSFLSFGTWWNGDAGIFRRIRGQGVEQHKRFDFLDFKDRPDIARKYPYLYRFIEKRQRDQAWGRRYFPIFPDILFYLKFFLLYPMLIFFALNYYGSRKENKDYFRRTLTRDSEIEETFFVKHDTLIAMRDKYMGMWDRNLKWFLTMCAFGRDHGGSIEKAESRVKEDNLTEFKNYEGEAQKDRLKEYWQFLTGRSVLRANGENSATLYLYGKLPLRFVSKCAGKIANCYIPVFLRRPLYGAYGSFFGVEMEDALEEDYRFYPSINAFFRRAIKAEKRPISTLTPMVCPVDGRVLHCGKCENGFVEQVKGVDYSLMRFLGRNEETRGNSLSKDSDARYAESLKINPQNDIFQIVMYLAPGDYHRFHSPCDFYIKTRRHFPGDLFSVNPRLANYMKDLFVLNERATYYGEWKHGFFSYCAVGATNVGNIIFHYDPQMVTNLQAGRIPFGTFIEKDFTDIDPRLPHGLPITKGEMLGEFNLGSTVVLVFEAPPDFKFGVQPGEKIKLGQFLGSGC